MIEIFQKMLAVVPAYAATPETISITPTAGLESLDKLSLGSIISGAISLLIIATALVFFFILIMGGLKWITSGGDEKKLAVARNELTNALVGLAIVFGAWAIMKLINSMFGINIFALTFPTFLAK